MSAFEPDTESLTTLHWVGIAAAAVTGLVHVLLAFGVVEPSPDSVLSGLGIAFLLAGLGFFGAIGLVVVGYRRRLVYAVGIPYTAAQILGWYALNFDGVADMLASIRPASVADKLAQVVLIAVLIVLLRRER